METHQPCDKCGSSDSLQINDNGSAFCHSNCGYIPPKNEAPPKETPLTEKKTPPFQQVTGQPKSIPERGLSLFDCKAYGIVSHHGETYFPYCDEKGQTIAYKIRGVGKEFYSKGAIKDGCLFGQQLFPRGSAKTITITEGEYDAVASYNLQGSKYPVVSIKNGAGSAVKDCKENYEYLDSFDRIVVNFDNDEVGQTAAADVLELFSGKAYNLRLKKCKDANDYLKSAYRKEYIDEWWSAEAYVPSGIVNGSELRELVLSPYIMPLFSWPWDGLNLLTYGIRPSEIVTLTAGTGTGKTTVLKQVIDKALNDTDFNIGMLSLEEGTGTAALSLMSMYANKRLHMPTKEQMTQILNNPDNIKHKQGLADEVTDAEKNAAFDAVLGDGRLWFYQHNGDSTVDSVCDTIKYMSKVAGCPVIVLDHISILVGMQHSRRNTSEREAIDDTMHMLRGLVEETGVTILLVSHLTKSAAGEASHEEGGRVKMSQMRGSNAIAQLSNIAIALERNTQADNPEDTDMTVVRILKNRFSGETGIATMLEWNEHTGKLNEQLSRVYSGDPL